MPNVWSEAEFIDALRKGVERTINLMAVVTDFHGGGVRTEYLLTADLAREFVERGLGVAVAVECLNRRIANAMVVKQDANVKTLRSKRTDVAIFQDQIFPIAIIEVKIGVSKIGKIKSDLDKITHTMNLMNSTAASRVYGAEVIQIHVPGSIRRYLENHFKSAIEKIESKLRDDVSKYAATRPGYSFEVISLQDAEAGISERQIDDENGVKVWGKHGHATRYHAILIKSTRPVPAPQCTVAYLKAVKEM